MGTLFFVKLVVSALVIVIVSELAKKYTGLGGLLAAMPLTTFLSMCWLYFEEKDTVLISDFLLAVCKGVLITFLFFIPCIFMLKKGMNFYLSVIVSLLILSAGVYIQHKFTL